jgi:predicted lipid-binding transport protein (Tim44 family)
MRRPARLLTAFAALALVLAPALADARPGGGSSSGSRGSRTYSAPPSTGTAPGGASRFDRSATPQYAPQQQPGYASPGMAGASRGGLFGGGFGAGLMGGLIGAGIGGMLFGHGMFGGISGFGGILGLMLQLLIVFFLVRWALRFFRNRAAGQPATAGGPGLSAREMQGGPAPAAGGLGGGAAAQPPVKLTPQDFQAFERSLIEINQAWSRRDLGALRRLSTPEMAGYFAQDLNDLAARGWQNETADVKLEKGDLAESWREGNVDYATVAMRFTLIDVTRDMSNGQVVEGDPARRQTATELWTFVREGGMGQWLVSAIQQAS